VNRWAGPGQPRACFGNLVATRLPALMVEHHPLPLLAEAGRPSVRRACTQVLVQAASGPLAIWNTHLEYHSGAQRALQVERILQLQRENAELVTTSAVPGEPGLYQHIARSARSVLCGDFNCGSDSSEYRSLIRGEGEDALVDLFTQLHGDAPRPPTFGCFERRYVSQPLACDHVFATRNIAGLARSIAVDGLTRLSDHQPVYVHWEGL
jgi:endonuclease/exonuclease/phosphatase family metal-dependent hydrolase